MVVIPIIQLQTHYLKIYPKQRMGSSPLLTLAHPTLWKSMEHPQFISLYRQEVNIDFLLQFFHTLFFTAQY